MEQSSPPPSANSGERAAAAAFARCLTLDATQLDAALAEEALRAGLDDEARARLRTMLETIPREADQPRGVSPDASKIARALVEVAYRSEFVAEAVAVDFECAKLLLDSARGAKSSLARPFDLADYRALLAPLAERPEPAARDGLGRLKRWHAVRVALRDLLGFGDIEEWMIELSAFAEAAIEFAHDHAWRAMVAAHGRPLIEAEDNAVGASKECACCVALMGKGGGRELNFSSDIDLVFAYEAEGETEGVAPLGETRRERRLENHKFFARLARRVAAMLGEPSDAGAPAAYRVDLRLRPDGETGPISRGLPSYRGYFAAQAALWERVAYAKARVVAVAGRKGFADDVEKAFRDFVYAKFYDKDVLGEIARLKRRIDAEAASGELAWRDLKRGVGGIRELEFALAGYQQLYGGDHPELASRRSAVWLVEALAASGLVRPERAARWREDYLLLRRVEQRLQLRRNRQTHLLPVEGDAGGADWRVLWPEESPAAIEKRVSDARGRVRDEFDRLFSREETPGEPAARLLDAFHDPKDAASATRLREGLAPFGLASADGIAALRRLRDGGLDAKADRARLAFFEAAFPNLLRVASQAPSPARSLARLESFLEAARASKLMLELLAEQPKALETLLRVFGAGERLSGILLGAPELLDLLFSDETLRDEESAEREIASFRRSLDRALQRAPSLEARKRSIRRLARQAELKAGARWALGLDDDDATAARLAGLARAALDSALACAWREQATPKTSGHAGGLAVLALGRLANDELTFLSDLDVAFVASEGLDADRLDACAKAAAATIDLLGDPVGGAAWEVDPRLRPTGRNAPLVAPLGYWRSYWRDEAETWEFLALSRSAPAGGESETARLALASARAAYADLPAKAAARGASVGGEILSMRARLEESAPKRAGQRDLKRGRGGIVDAEFAWQAAALAIWSETARATPDRLGDLPMSAIRERVDARLRDWLGEGDAAALRDDLAFLRRLETSTRLLRGRRDDAIPDGSSPEELEPVARAAGFLGADAAPRLVARLDEIADRNERALRVVCGKLDKWSTRAG